MTDRVDQPTKQTHTHRHKLGRRPYDRPPPSVTDSGAFSLPLSLSLSLSLALTHWCAPTLLLPRGFARRRQSSPDNIYMYLFVVLFSVLFRRVIGFFSVCVCVCVWGLVNAYVLFNASICFCFFFYYDGVAYHSL